MREHGVVGESGSSRFQIGAAQNFAWVVSSAGTRGARVLSEALDLVERRRVVIARQRRRRVRPELLSAVFNTKGGHSGPSA